MAKNTNTAAPAAPTTPAAPAAAKPATPVVRTMRAVPGTLQVLKQGMPYRGARAAWYAALCAHNGQPAQAYLDACTTKPPSLPASQRPEPASGWLSWFVRQGVCAVVPPAQAAAPAPTAPAK